MQAIVDCELHKLLFNLTYIASIYSHGFYVSLDVPRFQEVIAQGFHLWESGSEMASTDYVPKPCIQGPPIKGYYYKYGWNWDKVYEKNPLFIEINCFLHFKGKARVPHFKNICAVLWPNTPQSAKPFYFSPWTDKMLEAACEHRYLSVMGSGSSGKTRFFAVWAIVNFICAPHRTKVIVTSTTIKDGRGRIWGAICDYWLPIANVFPGKLVNSQGVIRYQQGSDISDLSGIQLFPGAPTKAKESVAKMIGFKAQRLILIADELPELSEAIVEAALSNLALNNQPPDGYFQLIGLGNPKNWFDPMARMTAPAVGTVDNLSVDTGEWETKLGWNLHFDGLKSPNVEAGRVVYPGLITGENIKEMARTLGDNSSSFWRMARGWPSPTGEDDCVYSDTDIRSSGSTQTLGNGFAWLDNDLTMVAALDPAFTQGGDRSMMVWGAMGKNLDGKKTLLVFGHETLFEDVTNKELSHSQQIISQFKNKCEKLGVQPRHMAIDATGGGKPFWDIISVMISKEVLAIDFGGAPSDAAVSAYDATPAKERYVNRVSELWWGGHEYMRTGQIKGISSELANEMCQRKKSEQKGNGLQLKIRVESKREMKARNLASPDLADSFFILVELCRQRLGFDSGTVVRKTNPQSQGGKTYKQLFKKYADVYKAA